MTIGTSTISPSFQAATETLDTVHWQGFGSEHIRDCNFL